MDNNYRRVGGGLPISKLFLAIVFIVNVGVDALILK